MKTEQGKYTIYNNNSNTVITVLNNENDHFIAAAIKSGLIAFYSDTTIGDFCESIKTDPTSRITFDGNFIVILTRLHIHLRIILKIMIK